MHPKVFWLITAILLVSIHRAEAQPTKISRIGYLGANSFSVNTDRPEAFRQGLRELGYVKGKNIFIEWQFAGEKPGPPPRAHGRSSASQGRHHYHRWSASNPRCESGNCYDHVVKPSRLTITSVEIPLRAFAGVLVGY